MKSRGLWVATGLLLASLLAPSHQVQAQSADQPELRVGLDDFWEEKLDPIAQSSGGANMIALMYDNPLRIDASGKVIPGIVEKWEAAPDGTSWTFHVRKDVLFHDGTPLTAKDVAYSYERAVSAGGTTPTRDANQWKGILGEKLNIELIDDYTLRIHTNGPQPFLPIYSATPSSPAIFVVPKDYLEKNGQDYFSEHPVGTGVYKFDNRSRGDMMSFVAWEKYWGGVPPDFKKVTLYLVPEEATRVSMLKTDEIDISQVGPEAAKDLGDEPGFTIVPGGRGLAWMAVIGSFHELSKGKPLGDVRVRQALSLAINRQEIIDTLLEGVGGMPAPPRVGFNNPDMSDKLRERWRPWAEQNYRFDLDAAKKLIADAGYGNGFSFDLWIAPDTSAQYLNDLGVVLTGYWEKIGAKVNIVTVDTAALNARRHTKSSTELIGKAILAGADTYRLNSIEYLSHFTSEQGGLDLIVGSPEQPEANKIWAEAQSTMDPAVYEKSLDRLIEIDTSSWAGIPIATAPVTFAFGHRVTGSLPPFAQFLARYYGDFKYTGK